MSKVKIEGNASGSGTLTISAPNTNTDRSLTLPDEAGEVLVNTSTGVDVTGTVTANDIAISDTTPVFTMKDTDTNALFRISASSSLGSVFLEVDDNAVGTAPVFTISTQNQERMRIDSSGNVLVGKTSAVSSTVGAYLQADGAIVGTRTNANPLLLDRLGTDGGLIILRKDNYDKGYIGIVNNELYIANTAGSDSGLNFGSNRIIPCTTSGGNRDNIIDLGNSASRFDDIYATNSTIQTSDQNDKQQIASLTDAEMNVAKRLSALFKTFKWNSSVEENGDNARKHSGIIAQDMQQAFTDEGLDASDYAMFISDTWWEKEISVDAVEEETDEEGNVIAEGQDAYTYMDTKEEATEGYTERTRLGVRYPELFAFINAYNDQRFADLETRIEALENA